MSSWSIRRRSQYGGVMVQALVVLAGLVALVATLATDQRATMQATQNRLRSRRAELAARAGLQRALVVLQAVTPNVVTQSDDWYTLGNQGKTSFDLQTSTFRVQIVDAASMMNINTATQQQLQLLPLTQEQQDALLDWREAGQTARASGAKDAYYSALDQPYNTKLGTLTTLSELLLIKGWTANTLYSTQNDVISTAVSFQDSNGQTLPLIAVLTAESGAPNQQANGSARTNLSLPNLNANTFTRMGIPNNVATQLALRGPYTSFSALLSSPGMTPNVAQTLLNQAAFTGATRVTGKININTASSAVLQTIPNMTSATASSIVGQQQTGFRTLSDLTTVAGLNSVPILAQIADGLTVGSDTFIVRIYGESAGYGVAIEATVGIRNGQAQVLTYNRLPDSSIPSWWAWLETPDTTIDAGGQS